jgi:hypothetical protein
MRARFLLIAVVLLAFVAIARADNGVAGLADARTAVERSLPFLEKNGVAWMNEKGCSSCHNVSFLLWSHTAARERGIAIDERKLAEWTDWTRKFSKSRPDGGGLDTVSQLLLARRRDAAQRDFLVDAQALIVRTQEPDGSWKAAGQLPSQGRPVAESNAVSTMWAVLALRSLDDPAPAAAEAIRHANEFLGRGKPEETNESLVTALLIKRSIGDAARAAPLLKELLARQRGDGGWSWRNDAASSDAFATGQALYALGRGGISSGDPAVAHARRYLIDTQDKDGAWPVPAAAISSTKNPGRLNRLAPIYRYWGTAWASIGLSETLPAAPTSAPAAGTSR